MEFKTVQADMPKDVNMILGMSHFIKTVEDVYEIMASSVPGAKFGFAFCEASGPCLIRSAGNDDELRNAAVKNAENIGAGHSFILFMRECFPINVTHALKSCFEIVSLYCATANPVQVLVAETEQGRGIIGVVDGYSPKGVESSYDVDARMKFLRDIGYKMSKN